MKQYLNTTLGFLNWSILR